MSMVHGSAVDELPLFRAPSPRPSICNLKSAICNRDRALRDVERNADQEWLAQAEHSLRVYLESHAEFFVDDFWEWAAQPSSPNTSHVTRHTSLPAPREARALGPVVLKASRLGWMKKTGRSKPSVRSHLSDKPIWESLLFSSAD